MPDRSTVMKILFKPMSWPQALLTGAIVFVVLLVAGYYW